MHRMAILSKKLCFQCTFSVGPLDVQLIGRKDPVSVGRLYEFRCQSVGARPPPHVTWWRGSIQLRENVTSRVSQITL